MMAASGRRRDAVGRDAVELWVGYGLILAVIWAPRWLQHWLYWVPVAWIAGVTWVRFEGWAAMGVRARNLLGSAWVVGVALGIAGVAAVVARRMGTLHAPVSVGQFVGTYVGYTVWSFVQQFLLLSFFLARLRRLVRGQYQAAAAAAGIFALAHLPNPVLMPLTLVWGMASCVLFLRYRNVWTLGLAHAVFGIAVAMTLPGYVTHNMRVGLGYLRYRRPGGVRRMGGSGSVRLHPTHDGGAVVNGAR